MEMRNRQQDEDNSNLPPPNTMSEPPQEGAPPPPFVDDKAAERETKRKTFKEMSLTEKAKYAASNITVEPLVICYMVPGILSSITTLNLNLEKACRVNLKYNDTVCSAIAARSEDYSKESAEASQLIADMSIWMSALRNVGPAILVLFVGSWSDRRHRRKPLALLPIMGDLCTTVGLLLCTIFLLQWPLEVAGIIESVFPAMTGGLPFMFIACYAYIGEVTSEEDRSFRIGMFAFFATLAAPVATAISGHVHDSLGYLGVYSLVSVLYILAILYAVFKFQEPTPPVPRPQGLSFFRDFFDWHHVQNTISVALKDGPGHRRLRVILLVVLYITIEGPIYGEYGNLFLFTLSRFKWTTDTFAYYSTYDIVIGLVGNAAVTLLIIRFLKVRDCYVGVIGVVSRIIAAPIFAFGNTTWHMYAGRFVTTLTAGAVIGMRSLATKMVSTAELGQLMGFLAIVEAIIPVAFSPLYSTVFSLTLSYFPGAYYFLTAVVSAIALICFLIIDRFQQNADNQEKKLGGEKGASSLGIPNLAFNSDIEKNSNTYL